MDLDGKVWGPNLGNRWQNVAKFNQIQCPAIGWEKKAQIDYMHYAPLQAPGMETFQIQQRASVSNTTTCGVLTRKKMLWSDAWVKNHLQDTTNFHNKRQVSHGYPSSALKEQSLHTYAPNISLFSSVPL